MRELVQKPKAVSLVCVCPHCHESVELVLTKKDLKELLRDFKLPTYQAQIRSERRRIT